MLVGYSNDEGIFVVSFGNGFLFCHSIQQRISVAIQGRISKRHKSRWISRGFLFSFKEDPWISVVIQGRISKSRLIYSVVLLSFKEDPRIYAVIYNVDGFLW